MRERMAPQLGCRLAEKRWCVGLDHRRRRVFARPGAFEGIAARLDDPFSIARLAAGAAQLVALIIKRFQFGIGGTPVLNGDVMAGDRLLTVALLVMTLGNEVGRQEPPDLAVP